MTKLFKDYIWKKGIPYGIGPTNNCEGTYYKVISDPYHKRYSIEKYEGEDWNIIYDSALFDFRLLRSPEQASWQKTVIEQSDKRVVSVIRNQDDRLIVQEHYYFEKDLCRECAAFSIHGIPVSKQKMFYTTLGDPFDGVILYDNNDHQVMSKKYRFDSTLGEFTELLEERWEGN